MSKSNILSFGGEAMIRVVSAWKIVNRSGYEYEPGKRYFDEERVATDVTTLNTDLHMKGSEARLRPIPCFLLEVQGDRGKPSYFDLGSPVEVEGG